MKCSNCGNDLPPQSRFCLHCGTKVPAEHDNKCSACGTALKPNAQFCHQCGQSVAPQHTGAAAHPDIEQEVFRGEEKARRPLWLTLLPLLGSVAVVAILFLLFYPHSNPEPAAMPAENSSPPAPGNQGQMDMAAMAPIFQQVDSLKNAIAQNPKDQNALMHLAAMYDMAGKYDQAAQYYQELLKIAPENVEARMNLAGAYFNIGQREQALSELNNVLKYRPNYDFAMYNMGVIYAAMSDKDKAREWWNKVITGSPTSDLARRAMEGMKLLNQ